MPKAPRRFRILLDGRDTSATHPINFRRDLPALRLPLARGRLTPREIEVLTLLAQGNAYARIAYALSMSEDTAKFHIRKARRKLGAKTRAQAVAIALIRGFVRPYKEISHLPLPF